MQCRNTDGPWGTQAMALSAEPWTEMWLQRSSFALCETNVTNAPNQRPGTVLSWDGSTAIVPGCVCCLCYPCPCACCCPDVGDSAGADELKSPSCGEAGSCGHCSTTWGSLQVPWWLCRCELALSRAWEPPGRKIRALGGLQLQAPLLGWAQLQLLPWRAQLLPHRQQHSAVPGTVPGISGLPADLRKELWLKKSSSWGPWRPSSPPLWSPATSRD